MDEPGEDVAGLLRRLGAAQAKQHAEQMRALYGIKWSAGCLLWLAIGAGAVGFLAALTAAGRGG